jgi:hypothetical protein
MKKLHSLIFAVLVCASTAFAGTTGQVVKVNSQSVTLHWQVEKAHTTRHGEAGGGYGSASREFSFKLTPQTTYWQGGKQVALSNIQKGAKINVTSVHGVVSRIDIL